MRALLHRFGTQVAPDFEEVLIVALHVALVLLLAWASWRLCSRLMRFAHQRMVARSASLDAINRIETMNQVLRYAAAAVILVVAGMLTLDQIGIAIAPLVATAGVAGIAIGLGLQGLLKDYFAGAFLIEDQIRKGDVIEAGARRAWSSR
jgi:small conductance mechanosensitive channel